jgi:hypothetical protein
LIGGIYKALWSRWGGRQWTAIMRDSLPTHPIPWLLGSFFLGLLGGHLFWGKKWKVGEGRDV